MQRKDFSNREAEQMARADQESSISNIVTLLVGPEQTRYTVAQELLCAKVPFFLNAFEGNYIESHTKTFTFPDDEPERFGDLVDWLKEGSLAELSTNPTWFWLASIWVFADKYRIDDLQNETIDAIHGKFAAHRTGINISQDTLYHVVDNTFPRSPLRRIFVDMLTNGISLQQLPSLVQNIPPEMLQDMVIALKTTVYRNNPSDTSLLTNPLESYHVSSAHCKAIAMPAEPSSGRPETPLTCSDDVCHNDGHIDPSGVLYLCTHHQVMFCADCGPKHRRHRGLKMFSLTTTPHGDSITGESCTIIDAQLNDSGFYCDGPDCDPDQDQSMHKTPMLMSGDRYHCLSCRNTDYCSLCIRGTLTCKENCHDFLRIRPTFAKAQALRDVSISVRQERVKNGLCCQCGSEEHETKSCEERTVGGLGPAGDVEVED